MENIRQEIYDQYMKWIITNLSGITYIESVVEFVEDLEAYLSNIYKVMHKDFESKQLLDQYEIENEDILFQNYYVLRNTSLITNFYVSRYTKLWDIFNASIEGFNENHLKFHDIVAPIVCKDIASQESQENRKCLFDRCLEHKDCENEENQENCKACFKLQLSHEDGQDHLQIDVFSDFYENELLPKRCILPEGRLIVLVLDEDMNDIIPNDIPVFLSSIYYRQELKMLTLDHTKRSFFSPLFEKFKQIWNQIELEKNRGDIRDIETLEMLEMLCYKIHWLFANITPFFRGSAAAAKILLNVCLIKCGLQPVKETEEYLAHSDWIALLSPRFDDYFYKIKQMQVFEPWIDFTVGKQEKQQKDSSSSSSSVSSFRFKYKY